MAEILLTTLNAKYIHCAFGLRYLMANLGELQQRARILEFEVTQRPIDVAESLLVHRPRIIGLGVYVWNAAQSRSLVSIIKRVSPETVVILGGPEVSYETDAQEVVQLADHTLTGEADLEFPRLCRRVLAGAPPAEKILAAAPPRLEDLALPYDLYTEEDLEHRVIYVESSRGCPFACEFCLSALDIPVRVFPPDAFLANLERLLNRGARRFKFVDRTFNSNLKTAEAILQFFLDRLQPGLFLHFEMVPDRFPDALREKVLRFPPGTLQFEVGVQTLNPEVAERISRRQDYARLAASLRWLREHTSVHLHADLIAGLPGESLESFARGFDALVALRPQEIQVGILKRLRGTPIARHDAAEEMVYDGEAPYEILRNRVLDFRSLQRLRRFARFWDLVANSGRFVETAPLIWRSGSPFAGFLRWSDWLQARIGRRHGIALDRLAELLLEFLTRELGEPPDGTAACLWRDYQRAGHRDPPGFLVPHLDRVPARQGPERRRGPLSRQQRHRGPPALAPARPDGAAGSSAPAPQAGSAPARS